MFKIDVPRLFFAETTHKYTHTHAIKGGSLGVYVQAYMRILCRPLQYGLCVGLCPTKSPESEREREKNKAQPSRERRKREGKGRLRDPKKRPLEKGKLSITVHICVFIFLL